MNPFSSLPLVHIHFFLSIKFSFIRGFISYHPHTSFRFPMEGPPLGAYVCSYCYQGPLFTLSSKFRNNILSQIPHAWRCHFCTNLKEHMWTIILILHLVIYKTKVCENFSQDHSMHKPRAVTNDVVVRTLDSHPKVVPSTLFAEICVRPTSWRWALHKVQQTMKHYL